MVLKSSVELPGSRDDGVILGVVHVNVTRQRFRHPMLGTSTQLAALAIDPSSLYKAQKQAQTAADAGALAATQDLPSNATGAANDGTTYARQNYPGASVTRFHAVRRQLGSGQGDGQRDRANVLREDLWL